MPILQFLLQLGAALLMGAVVGLERQWRQRMAGTRTTGCGIEFPKWVRFAFWSINLFRQPVKPSANPPLDSLAPNLLE